MLSIISLPEGFIASTTATMSALFGDFAPYIELVLGVILTAIVIEIVIGVLRR